MGANGLLEARMIKGVSRRIIVIKSPDPKLFERAVFVLKDNVYGKDGMTEEKLVEEAQTIAARLFKGDKKHKRLHFRMPACLYVAAGAIAAGAAWIAAKVFA